MHTPTPEKIKISYFKKPSTRYSNEHVFAQLVYNWLQIANEGSTDNILKMLKIDLILTK